MLPKACNSSLMLNALLQHICYALGLIHLLTLAFLFLSTEPPAPMRLVSVLSLQMPHFLPVSVLWSFPIQPSGVFTLFLTFIIALFQQKCINCPPHAIFWESWRTHSMLQRGLCSQGTGRYVASKHSRVLQDKYVQMSCGTGKGLPVFSKEAVLWDKQGKKKGKSKQSCTKCSRDKSHRKHLTPLRNPQEHDLIGLMGAGRNEAQRAGATRL